MSSQVQSQSSSLCNLMLQEQDLRKLQELDPYQTDGFKTLAKVEVPIRIIYCDELGHEIKDNQILTVQILTKWIKSTHHRDKQTSNLEQIRLCIMSEQDLYLNFACNCSTSFFQGMKTKNSLNLRFNDFPNSLVTILKNCQFPEQGRKLSMSMNLAELRISYQGTARLSISQQTEYKNLDLIQLFFSTCNVQKVQQSIIYRYNYQSTKLAMLENSIKSVYDLLAKKNQPLLQFIQKTVGINQ